MAESAAPEARALIQRGLEHYAHGRLREAVQVWESAARLAPKDEQVGRLLAFARGRMREGDARAAARPPHDTLESPIPGFLASLTAVDAAGGTPADQRATPTPDEWSRVDTRRVVAALREPGPFTAGEEERDAADTWKDLPIQGDKLQASARGLVAECQAALDDGHAESAALAAELALQLNEQTSSPDVDGIVESARPLFERAFCACVGDMKCAPIRAIPVEELASNGFDHRAAFLMSHMDGGLSMSDLVHVAGMSRFETLRLMSALRRARAVDMVPAAE